MVLYHLSLPTYISPVKWVISYLLASSQPSSHFTISHSERGRSHCVFCPAALSIGAARGKVRKLTEASQVLEGSFCFIV